MKPTQNIKASKGGGIIKRLYPRNVSEVFCALLTGISFILGFGLLALCLSYICVYRLMPGKFSNGRYWLLRLLMCFHLVVDKVAGRPDGR